MIWYILCISGIIASYYTKGLLQNRIENKKKRFLMCMLDTFTDLVWLCSLCAIIKPEYIEKSIAIFLIAFIPCIIISYFIYGTRKNR